MKSLRAGLVLVLGLALMVIGLAGVAEAQYGPTTPLSVTAAVSGSSVTGQITGGTAPYTVTATITSGGIVTTVAGTVNADGSYSLPAGSTPAGSRAVIVVTDSDGTIASVSAGAGSAVAIVYTGPFNASPAKIASEFRTPLIPKSPAAAAGAGETHAQLAFTGAQSSMLVVGGMSLVLVGGVAVLATRKRPEA